MSESNARRVAWRAWAPALERGEPVPETARALLGELIAQAQAFRSRAHSPYSKLSLGALLLTPGGELYGGVNVENASFGLTNCAERSAVFSAVSAGEREFVLCFLQGQGERPIPPCGACRQVLHEFAPRLWVVSRGSTGELLSARLDRLLPAAMGLTDLP